MKPSALRDLATHWRITPVVVSIYALASIIGAFISLDPSDGRLLEVSIAAGVATMVAVAGIVAGWLIVTWLHIHALEQFRFLLVAPLVGAVRGVILFQTADAMAIAPAGQLIPITISSAFSALVWLALGGFLKASHSAYRRRYRSMLLQGVPGVGVGADEASFDWDAHPEVSRLRSSLSAASRIEDADPTTDDLVRASAAIRWEIEQTLRPLSHRLWFGTLGQEPRARWSWVLHDAVAGFTVPVVPVSTLWLVGGVIGGVALLGWGQGAVAAALSTVILAASSALGARLMRHRSSVLAGVLLVLSCGALTVFGTDAIMRALGFPTSLTWGNGVAVGLWLAVMGMVVVSASISLADADRRIVLDVAGHRAARASAYLHNSLQAELTGLAMQLDAAAIDPDPQQARVALERLNALVTRSLAEDFASFEQDPTSRAQSVAAAWAGICDVTLMIDPGAAADRRLMAAVQAAEELIANAIRHSGATIIRVELSSGESGLRVVCWANTTGAVASGSGLGSHLLASVAPGGIETDVRGGGTTYCLDVV